MQIKYIIPQGIQGILYSDLAGAQHEVLVSLYKWQLVRVNIYYAERQYGQPIPAPSDGDENPCSNTPRMANEVFNTK